MSQSPNPCRSFSFLGFLTFHSGHLTDFHSIARMSFWKLIWPVSIAQVCSVPLIAFCYYFGKLSPVLSLYVFFDESDGALASWSFLICCVVFCIRCVFDHNILFQCPPGHYNVFRYLFYCFFEKRKLVFPVCFLFNQIIPTINLDRERFPSLITSVRSVLGFGTWCNSNGVLFISVFVHAQFTLHKGVGTDCLPNLW